VRGAPLVDQRVLAGLGVQHAELCSCAQRRVLLAQRDKRPHLVKQRAWIIRLPGDAGAIRPGIERQVEGLGRRAGEPGVGSFCVPLHGVRAPLRSKPPSLKRLSRPSPFGNQGRLGIVTVEPGPDLLPETLGLPAPTVVLNQREGHVDPEARRAALQPEAHDVLYLLADGLRTGRVDRLLPGMPGIRTGEAEVQRRLKDEEIGNVAAVAFIEPADTLQTLGRCSD